MSWRWLTTPDQTDPTTAEQFVIARDEQIAFADETDAGRAAPVEPLAVPIHDDDAPC